MSTESAAPEAGHGATASIAKGETLVEVIGLKK